MAGKNNTMCIETFSGARGITQKEGLSAKGFLLLASCFLLLASSPAYAACAGPTGNAGDMIYNSDYHVPQFCNGTAWIPMGKDGLDSTAALDVQTFTTPGRIKQKAEKSHRILDKPLFGKEFCHFRASQF